MKALQCDSCGKFYDEDKYSKCPHCKAEKLSEKTMNAAVTESHEEKKGKKFKGLFGKKNKSDKTVKSEITEEKLENNENVNEHQTLSEAILNANSMERSAREKTQGYYKLSRNIEPAVGWLTCIKGECIGETFSIKAGKNCIGRSSSNEISLEKENGVFLNRHAQITFEPRKRQFFIQNGENDALTYVNDEPIVTFAELKNYDIISVGDAKLVFIALCGEKFTWDDYTV